MKKNKHLWWKIFAWFVMIAIISLFVYAIWVSNWWFWDEDIDKCQDNVKLFLKAPSTAIFMNMWKIDSAKYWTVVEWTVESMNSFWWRVSNGFFCKWPYLTEIIFDNWETEKEYDELKLWLLREIKEEFFPSDTWNLE